MISHISDTLFEEPCRKFILKHGIKYYFRSSGKNATHTELGMHNCV